MAKAAEESNKGKKGKKGKRKDNKARNIEHEPWDRTHRRQADYVFWL